jgi:hypothetical protein
MPQPQEHADNRADCDDELHVLVHRLAPSVANTTLILGEGMEEIK